MEIVKDGCQSVEKSVAGAPMALSWEAKSRPDYRSIERTRIGGQIPHGLIIVLIASCLYLVMNIKLGLGVNQEVMFSTPDALSYRSVALWMAGGPLTVHVSTRPFLFPAILLISPGPLGAYWLWLFQLALWLATIYLTFQSIKKATGSTVGAYTGSVLTALNVTLVALTFHALTEVTTAFLLSALVANLASGLRWYDAGQLNRTLLLLALLSLVKPIFLLPYLVVLTAGPAWLALREYRARPVMLAALVCFSLPVAAQTVIVTKIKGALNFSTIGEETFKHYLFAQGLSRVEQLDRDTAIQLSLNLSPRQRAGFVVKHISTYAGLFMSNVRDNIRASSTFISYPSGEKQPILNAFMRLTNRIYYSLHLVFILPVICAVYGLFRSGTTGKAWQLALLSALIYFYILSTGISFFQGDRLVLPTIALWTFVYSVISAKYWPLTVKIVGRYALVFSKKG